MVILIGCIMFFLGVVAFVAWLPMTFYFLQGIVAFSLLFWGLLAMIVGYSERKARREYQTALDDEDGAPSPTAEKIRAETSQT